jgi:two-component system, cell cycle response regulator
MYRILLVDHEPAPLWSLSNFLRLYGYEVWQASDAEQALAVCDYALPDFIVADWELPSGSGLDLCRRVRGRALAGYVYFILRTATHDPNELIDALQAGVDDFIARTIVHGELLARLRSGARMLEYERRLTTLAASDPLTGLGSAAAFHQALPAALAGASRHRHRACVYADADYFGRVNYLHGHPMGDAAIQALAERIASAAGDLGMAFRLEADQFAVLLADADEPRAIHWAEQVRVAFERQPLAVAGRSIDLRISLSVAPLAAETTAEAAMTQLEQALDVAKRSGRNRVVAASGVQAIIADRASAAAAADPLRSAVARDVMTSTTVCFSHDQGLASADEFLRDSGGEMLSVVDGDGKLLGTIPAEQLRSGEACQELPATVGERLAGDAAVYEEETTVQTLYEFFQHSDAERVEIVHAGRPTGFVSRGSLAALGERLTPGHFAAIRPPAQASDYLLVADLG